MALEPQPGHEDLLARVQTGDEDAFLTLYRHYQGPIFRFATHMTGSAALAEDVVQEVFLVLMREDLGFRPELGTLGCYLFGIARKLVLRQLDRNRRNVALEADVEEFPVPAAATHADPLADLTRREGLEALRRAVGGLPRRYREVVVLCDLEEVDYAEAALVLACPIGTIRSRLHRARALLHEKLSLERSPRPSVGALRPLRSLI
jgi:RNA polymerase sigma-70 factor, ECF subfamily